ncbi:2-oxoglutarate-dependent dioxygenase DAO-like [Rutidosis leptorrhynchoides]|uniref:2-oxoglutarate-dependent dioxygenase DAO-like n=1 Tax=Rutidosis leptorrhynchoides TaxID=125765 RepID=UPI003A997542
MATTNSNIPVIDLNDLPNQSSELISACEEWGCFRLINHHHVLPDTLMSEMKSVVTSLFDLPLEIKQRYSDANVGSGYIAPNPKYPLYESFGVHDFVSRSGIHEFCSQLEATPHQRETIIRYADAVHELFVEIFKKLAQGLRVKSEDIGFEKWPCQFRINKYHFTTQCVGSPGGPLHTDSGFITILQDDEQVGGLEVVNKSGEFIAVDPWPNTLVVNLGDMATVWSNGRFCNAKHMVHCKEAKTRVTFASFLMGPKGIVEPLPELVDDDHPRVYKPTTYEDYRKLRFSTKLHIGEALEHIKL